MQRYTLDEDNITLYFKDKIIKIYSNGCCNEYFSFFPEEDLDDFLGQEFIDIVFYDTTLEYSKPDDADGQEYSISINFENGNFDFLCDRYCRDCRSSSVSCETILCVSEM